MRATLAILLCLLGVLSAAAEPRTALVIGNAAYAYGPLANAVNDALHKLGVEICEIPITPRRILAAISKASPAAVGST